VLISAAIVSCSGDNNSPTPSPTASPAPTNSPSPTTSPTPSPVFDEKLALEHVRQLAEVIGVRAPGTEGERQGAEYIRDQLQSFGYQAELQPFPIPIYEGINTDLQVVSPGSQHYASIPMTYSPAGEVESELVLVGGTGEPGDFPSNSSGHIVLIERGTITLRQKVVNAEAAGAIGVIIYNNQPGNFTATASTSVSIPAVTISQEDGQALRSLAGSQAVRVHLRVESVTSQGESRNVLARAPGAGDCRVLIGGHMDSVSAGPGANDNASGTAVVIELSRVLAALHKTNGLCIALFGAEEAGLLGSDYYASRLSAGQLGGLDGMLNFDMLAVGDEWPMDGSPSLVDLAIQEAQKIGVDAYAGDLPPGVGSDHANFVNRGVPGVLFNCFCDANYHTAADRYEFVKADRLKTAGEIGLLMVQDLLGG
jgi:aminopeptidase YwaD